MTGWRSGARSPAAVLAAAFVLGAVVVGAELPAGAAPGTDELRHRLLFRFADPTITESSGLVDRGSVVYTMNDSGAGPLLYAVDPATGRTTGVTTYSSGSVTDVEALAPGRRGTVWVGDIGDNLRRRDTIAVYRVKPGGGAVPPITLAYPDGARDAETLLVHPRTGRLFVVSKTVFGGVVYAARSLDPGRRNRLTRFAEVAGLVTDGAFFPDGRHVLLRTYGTATVYTFPGFDVVGTVVLPPQQQGEGVSIGRDGRILLSSEGAHSEVLEVELPEALRAAVVPVATPSVVPSAAPSTAPSGAPSSASPTASGAPGSDGETAAGWGWAALAVAGAAFLGVVVRGRTRRRA